MSAVSDPTDLPPEERTPIDEVASPRNRPRTIDGIARSAVRSLAMVREAAPRNLYLALALQVVIGLITTLQLLVVKELVTELLDLARTDGGSVDGIIVPFAALLGSTVVSGVLAALLQQQQRLLTEVVARYTTDRIVDVATQIELSKFEDAVFYDQLERARSAGAYRPIEMVNNLMAVLLGVVTSIGIVIALLTLAPLVVPFVFLAAIPLLVSTLMNSKKTYRFEYEMTSHARELIFLYDLFTEREPAKELRVFSAVDWLRSRWDALCDERVRRMREFLKGRLRNAIVATLLGALGTAIALGSLVFLLATDRAEVAAAATAALAMQVLAGRLAGVTSSLGSLVEAGMFLDDLFKFLSAQEDEIAARKATARKVPAGNAFERLEVRDLDFTYPGTDRQVLSGVSLDVHRGEVIAIVGENGSGKTTLVKLLTQLYDPPAESIRWNGDDIRALDVERLRSQTTVLFQDFVRYHLTAADNIALGRSDHTAAAEEIERAARQAGAHDVIAGFPQGYQTRLGRQFEGGFELSGGQWQRLALARAFYRGGDFLIMDEPTAALDPRAEYRLFEQMRELSAGRSVLLISHRFANVRMADRIYVMEGGRVVESGDHGSLMAEDGLYADLFRLQASSYVDEAT